MADFVPPAGPPPPKVPEGWTARWNDQYKEWFYVNLYTKQSQWEKPTEPVYPPGQDGAPPGPPPGYQPGSGPAPTDAKTNPFHSSTPENASGSKSQEERDAEFARRLQEEENTRSLPGASPAPGGAAASFYGGQPSYGAPAPNYSGQGGYGQSQSSYPDQLPPRPEERGKKSGGFLGKLMNKVAAGKQSSHGSGGYGGGYPQQQYGGGGMAPGMGRGYGGGMPYGGQGMPYAGQGHGYAQQPPKKSGGMGAAGGAALGLGAGLIGGALIADAIDDHEQEAYQDGYQDGANDFDDGGGGDF